MPVTFDRNAEPGLIRLEGDVNISEAVELKRILLEALQAKREVRIALETATGVDITAVQLLWAAERQAREAGMVFALEGTVPEALRATLEEAGFDRVPLAGESPTPSEVR